MTEPLISVRNLFFTYSDETEALRNVALDIHRNQVFVLFGPSRAGKSTLLRLFNRLSDLIEGTQRRGEILLDGRDIFAPEVNVSTLRRRVSMVFAVPTPLPGSIYANIVYGGASPSTTSTSSGEAVKKNRAMGALGGAASGAAIGSAVPGIGTAVGAVAGGLLGAIG